MHFLVLLAPLTCHRPYPEVVGHDGRNHEQNDADKHQPALQLFLAKLRCLPGGALCFFGGGLW